MKVNAYPTGMPEALIGSEFWIEMTRNLFNLTDQRMWVMSDGRYCVTGYMGKDFLCAVFDKDGKYLTEAKHLRTGEGLDLRFTEPNEPANSSVYLPYVDTNTVESWASTFAHLVICYAKLKKEHGKVILQVANPKQYPFTEKDKDKHIREPGQEYTPEEFCNDAFVGELPWNEEVDEQVQALLRQNPAYIEAMKELGLEETLERHTEVPA